MQGDYATARALVEQTLALSEEMDEILIRASALLVLGMIGLAKSEPQARPYILDSVRLNQKMDIKHKLTSSLIAVAGLVLQEGNPQFAAQLLSAAVSALEALNAAMAPEMKSFHAQTLAKVKDALGEESFNAAWQEGSRWSLADAVAYVLRETP